MNITFKENNGSLEVLMNGVNVGLISQIPKCYGVSNPGKWDVSIITTDHALFAFGPYIKRSKAVSVAIWALKKEKTYLEWCYWQEMLNAKEGGKPQDVFK